MPQSYHSLLIHRLVGPITPLPLCPRDPCRVHLDGPGRDVQRSPLLLRLLFDAAAHRQSFPRRRTLRCQVRGVLERVLYACTVQDGAGDLLSGSTGWSQGSSEKAVQDSPRHLMI
jgi:hypothetical protein